MFSGLNWVLIGARYGIYGDFRDYGWCIFTLWSVIFLNKMFGNKIPYTIFASYLTFIVNF